MTGGMAMTKPAKRQHYIARFYLRNFAEPMFSDNLCVYNMRKRHWERRTPDGVGWFPHLCSMIDMRGKRTDGFDQFLKRTVEDPAAPAMKKLAAGEKLEHSARSAVALFIALTAARSPEMMKGALSAHLEDLRDNDRAELDAIVKVWCHWTGRPCHPTAHAEFLKPTSFGAIWIWSLSLQHRLLQWDWHLVRTSRDQPFVTSDQPVRAQWDQERDVRLVTFPVSSEVALVVTAGAQFNEARDRTKEAQAMNRGTMDRASDFVVACKESFPGDGYLAERPQLSGNQQ